MAQRDISAASRAGRNRSSRQVQPRPGQQPSSAELGEVRSQGLGCVFELHYTTSGKPTRTSRSWGSCGRRGRRPHRYFFHNGPTAKNLAIPPNAATRSGARGDTRREPHLVYMQPHMHLRGKDFEFRVVSADGATRTVLKGQIDFEWQMGVEFAEPVDLPEGSRIQFICHFDNSGSNGSTRIPKSGSSGATRTGTR